MKIIEIGHNHMGSVEIGTALINKICKTSCDAISVQIREQSFYSNNQRFDIPHDFYKKAAKIVKKSNKKFGIAISNLDMVEFSKRLEPEFYKLLSKDLENHSFLKKIKNQIDRKIYLSTGMSGYNKINEALNTLGDSVTLIHTSMSDDLVDVNLSAIQGMRERFQKNIAYGNHCKNLNAVYAALAFKPESIFLYAKGNDDLAYPDNKHAVSIDSLQNFLSNIEEIEKTIGSGIKYKVTKGIKGQK